MSAPSSGQPRRDIPVVPTAASLLRALHECIEASGEALFTLAADGRVTSWNRNAERIFGSAEADVLAKPVTELFADERSGRLDRLIDSISAVDPVDHVELELLRPDGLPIPISLTLRPIVDARGGVAGAVAIARDLTETLLAQATLAEMEARLREGEALAHVGRWQWDVRTGAVQWSDELHRIHGIEPRDFGGDLDAHLGAVHDDDVDRARGALHDAASTGRSFEDEYRIVRPTGETRWLSVRAEAATTSAGDVVGLRGLAHDVTDRRQLRQQD
jgi:PAS domain S-box-containing protein